MSGFNESIRQAVSGFGDGLINVVSGLGGNNTKRANNRWELTTLNEYQQLEAAYQTNWIARGIVDIPARDITREWRSIKSEGAEDIEGLEKKLCIQQKVEEAIAWARLYGGSGLLMLTGQDLTKPLDINKVKKDSLDDVIVFDRWDLVGQTLNTWDILSPNYYRPEFYSLRGTRGVVHWTHVARFTGERLPRRLHQITQGWGDSVLRKCLEDVADLVASKDGIANLLQEANVDIIKREGLADELTTDQDEAIIKRYQSFGDMKSSVRIGLLDGSETFERKTLDLNGVAPIIEQFITWISGAARIPVTKLFGTSAKGLNATGDGDLKNYYDDIRALQGSSVSQSLRDLDEVLVRSAIGEYPDSFDFQWNTLSQVNSMEKATTENTRADRDLKYLSEGIITTSQIQRSLQSQETYQFSDEMIDQLESLEEPNMFASLPSDDLT